jgi:hypothetical protein
MNQSPLAMGLEWIDLVELDDLNPAVAQALEESGGRVRAADAVIDQIDLNPRGLFLQQQVGKFTPCLIILEDVAFKVDIDSGVLDGFEHRRVRRRPVNEQSDLVPLGQGALADGLHDGNLAIQEVRRPNRSLEPFHDRPARLGRQQPLGGDQLARLPARGHPVNRFGNLRQGRTCRAKTKD